MSASPRRLLLVHDGLSPDQDLLTVVRHVYTVRD